jgi:hypothetical protein
LIFDKGNATVGLAYYRLLPADYEPLRSLIEAHEAELVGPRARGYWFDRPDDYDYEGVRLVARQLDEAGTLHGIERLELSEVQAHSLSLLDFQLPADSGSLTPSLFLTGGTAESIARYLKIARRKLGGSPELVLERLEIQDRDPRFAGYLRKQVRHLREALPLVWNFHVRAVDAGNAVLLVDLRARDLEIPDAVELMGV